MTIHQGSVFGQTKFGDNNTVEFYETISIEKESVILKKHSLTRNDVLSMVTDFSKDAVILDSNGKEVNDTQLIGTDMFIKDADKYYRIVIKGDADSDTTDYLAIKYAFIGGNFDSVHCSFEASDIDNNGIVNCADYLIVHCIFLKLISYESL